MSKNVHVITTFNNKGKAVYGDRFVDSNKKYIEEPLRWKLFVYNEDRDDFVDMAAYKEFCYVADKHLELLGLDAQTNYRYQAKRFCHKVFALYTHLMRIKDRGEYPENLLWFDADVEFFATPDDRTISEICPPPTNSITYLNRTAYPHSEPGFIGFDLASFHSVVEVWYKFYTHNLVFKLREWHDVIAFDLIREILPVNSINLSGDTTQKHVWPTSILSTFCCHNKGPGRKIEAYGSTVSNAIVTDKRLF